MRVATNLTYFYRYTLNRDVEQMWWAHSIFIEGLTIRIFFAFHYHGNHIAVVTGMIPSDKNVHAACCSPWTISCSSRSYLATSRAAQQPWQLPKICISSYAPRVPSDKSTYSRVKRIDAARRPINNLVLVCARHQPTIQERSSAIYSKFRSTRVRV